MDDNELNRLKAALSHAHNCNGLWSTTYVVVDGKTLRQDYACPTCAVYALLAEVGRLKHDLLQSQASYEHWSHADPGQLVKKAADQWFEILKLRGEVQRLKRGDFTSEEFQGLYHHRDERPGCTRADFEAGCREYQRKLFGD